MNLRHALDAQPDYVEEKLLYRARLPLGELLIESEEVRIVRIWGVEGGKEAGHLRPRSPG